MKRRDFIKTPVLGVLLPGVPFAGKLLAPDERQESLPASQPAEVVQRMHPDFVTYEPGMEYFYLGNGDIQGAVQYAPKEGKQSFVGFTLMDPENFCRKWSTFLYHPERGFTNTKLGVTLGSEGGADEAGAGMYAGVRGFSVSRENFRSIGWKYPDGVPVVSLAWDAGACAVEEEFFVPHAGAVLFRRIRIRNVSPRPHTVKLSLSLYANFGLFTDIHTGEKERAAHASGLAKMTLSSLDPNATVYGRYDVRVDLQSLGSGQSAETVYVYAIKGGEQNIRRRTVTSMWRETSAYWKQKSVFSSGNAVVDQLYAVSRTELKSVISRSGRMDAGTWMYNMEWLGDHALATEALLRCGFVDEARLLIERNLRDSIGPDGRTVESGRWFGYDYTEINQNGMMLFAVWNYLCWTGDRALLKHYWPAIRRCGDFPLKDYFLDPATHMVRNRREFWERSDTYGIEEGYELAYQVWVSFGLAKGALVARTLGDEATAERWSAASRAMQEAMFSDPAFRLIEDGHLIKRRTRGGAWQRVVIPPKRSTLPPGSPIAVEESPSLEPDTIVVLPIMYEMIDPFSSLSKETLRWVDALWNQRWDGGGYPRYNVTSEDNPPAPWPIPSMLVARASAAAGEDDRVWRVLHWMHDIAGRSGSWFERYGQSLTPPMPPVGVVGWAWYEIINLCSHHIAGFRPELDALTLRPQLLRGLDAITTSHRVRGARVDLSVRREGGKAAARANGKQVPMEGGVVRIPYPRKGSILTVEVAL